MKQLLDGKTPRESSGTIWHTQGSGKSLTMMLMVREMCRHAELSNWKVLFVTDHTQLEDQLSETSGSIGFTVKVADRINPESPPSGNSLKELLSTNTADLVMAMIHKFRETDLKETFPKLKLTGFWESIPARNKLKAEIQKILLSPTFSRLPNVIENRAHIISRIMEIAENKNDIILYAE